MNPTIEKQSFVYVFHATGTPLCKIGVTTDIPNRLRSVQTGNPHKVVVLATWPGSRQLERKIHCRLARYRREGEWFDLSGVNIAEIGDIASLHVDSRRSRGIGLPSLPGHRWKQIKSGWKLFSRHRSVSASGKRSSKSKMLAFYSNQAVERFLDLPA